MTTVEPGASEVLTQGFRVMPRAWAFFATRPAASMTEGLLVLVQLVMAAITTAPCLSLKVLPSYVQGAPSKPASTSSAIAVALAAAAVPAPAGTAAGFFPNTFDRSFSQLVLMLD